MRSLANRRALLAATLVVVSSACEHRPLRRRVADAAPEATTAESPPIAEADASVPVDGRAIELPPPLSCESLRPLAGRPLLGAMRPLQALVSPDGRTLVLRATSGTAAPGARQPGDLYAISIPDGSETLLCSGVANAEWLGNDGDLLLKLEASQSLAVVSVAGGDFRVIAHRTCSHLAVPDGSRVLAIRDCDHSRGVLDVIDVRTGVTRTQGYAASVGDLTVSPDSRLAAYKALSTFADAGGTGAGALHVFDSEGRDQTLATPADVGAPWFVNDDLLIFQGPSGFGPSDIYRYVPSRGTVSLLAKARDVGFHGYRVSTAGSLLLAAIWNDAWNVPNQLVAIRLDGSGEVLLAKDLANYQYNQIGPSAFTFSRNGAHAVYINDQYSQVMAVPTTGGPSHSLAAGADFIVSPYADRVAVLDTDRNTGTSQLHMVQIASGEQIVTVKSDVTLAGPTFVPGDHGLLYMQPSGGLVQLHFLSFANRQSLSLASWSTSYLPFSTLPFGELDPAYPVDRTGCFVVVDHDPATNLGTRIVLLSSSR